MTYEYNVVALPATEIAHGPKLHIVGPGLELATSHENIDQLLGIEEHLNQLGNEGWRLVGQAATFHLQRLVAGEDDFYCTVKLISTFLREIP
jgi:hypothetical protein